MAFPFTALRRSALHCIAFCLAMFCFALHFNEEKVHVDRGPKRFTRCCRNGLAAPVPKVDDPPPRCSDQDRVFLHARKCLAVDHTVGLRRERRVNTDHIRFAQQILQAQSHREGEGERKESTAAALGHPLVAAAAELEAAAVGAARWRVQRWRRRRKRKRRSEE